MLLFPISPLSAAPNAMSAARRLLMQLSPGTASARDSDVLSAIASIWQQLVDQASAAIADFNYLIFDGTRLCWVGPANRGRCWGAVSGRTGYQDASQQSLRDRGPIPEGLWYVRQSEYQEMPDYNWIQSFLQEIGRTAWPGGESSWGRRRIWLLSAPSTEIYDRSGFSIHGGDRPGSAGCIDLTNQMPSFANAFRQYGKDMILVVRYGRQ